MSANPSFEVRPTKAELLLSLAERFVQTAEAAIQARGVFSFALSGGSTPKQFYELLASEPWPTRIPWENVLIYFGDDRAVAPSDDLSNYKMASEALFSKVSLPTSNIFRMAGEADDLDVSASEYEDALAKVDGILDVALLGIGPDGHTASLFPNSPQLEVTDKLVTATPVATLQPHVRRLTLTFPTINQAREAWFLITGAEKAEIVERVVEGPSDVALLPSQGVDNPNTTWFLDEGAAANLKTRR